MRNAKNFGLRFCSNRETPLFRELRIETRIAEEKRMWLGLYRSRDTVRVVNERYLWI